MQTEVVLSEVRTVGTRSGNVRYVSKDANGAEYTTFREEIGERAKQLQGRRVRLEYHEERRAGGSGDHELEQSGDHELEEENRRLKERIEELESGQNTNSKSGRSGRG